MMKIKLAAQAAKNMVKDFSAVGAEVIKIVLHAKVDKAGVTSMQVQAVCDTSQLVEILPYTEVEAIAEPVAIYCNQELLKKLGGVLAFCEDDLIFEIEDTFIKVSSAKKKVNLQVARLPETDIKGYRPDKACLINAKLDAAGFIQLINNAGYLQGTIEGLDNFTLSFRANEAKLHCYSTTGTAVSHDYMPVVYNDNDDTKAAREKAVAETKVSTVEDYRVSVPQKAVGLIKTFLDGNDSGAYLLVDEAHLNIRTINGVLTVSLAPKTVGLYKQTADVWTSVPPVVNCQVDAGEVDKAINLIELSTSKDNKLVNMIFGEKSLEFVLDENTSASLNVIASKGEQAEFLVAPQLLKSSLRKRGNICLRIIATEVNGKEVSVLSVGAGALADEFTAVTYVLPCKSPKKDTEA